MFIPSSQGAAASTDSVVDSSASSSSASDSPTVNLPSTDAFSPPPSNFDSENGGRETVHHMLFGSLSSIRFTILRLHQRGYAEPNDWSKPISTGRPNEMMAILTKRIRL
ncbi:MAG: hypothetical protein WA949_15930 [Phormidesmis sp.]